MAKDSSPRSQSIRTQGLRAVRDAPTSDFLLVVDAPGPARYRSYFLAGDLVVVGRGEGCDIRLSEDSLSRKHATLTRAGDVWQLDDAGSTNGTFVGDQRISSFVLQLGDQFHLAKCAMMIVDDRDPQLEKYKNLLRTRLTDSLTGLLNHEALVEAIAGLPRSLAGETCLIVLLELGQLDRLNTSVGRTATDGLIVRIAETIRHYSRDSQVFRSHGGKFGVIATENSAAHAQELVDNVAIAVRDAVGPRPPSVSAGYVVVTRGVSTDAALEQLERNLQKAIHLGSGGLWGGPLLQRGTSAPAITVPRDGDELTGVHSLDSGSHHAGRLSHREFLRELRPGTRVIAVTLRGIRALRASAPAKASDCEDTLDACVRELISLPEHVGRALFGETRDGETVLLALENYSVREAHELLRSLVERFEKNSQVHAVHVACGPALDVTDPKQSVDEALRGLEHYALQGTRTLPLPIGYALRSAEIATADRFFAVGRLHQAIVRWLFSVFAAELAKVTPSAHASAGRQIAKDLESPISDRHWVVMARELHRRLEAVPQAQLVLPSYVQMMSGSADIFDELEEFGTHRNRVVHGQDVHAAALANEWLPRLRLLLENRMGSLRDHTFRYIDRVVVLDDEEVDIHYKELTGDNPVLPTRSEHRAKPIAVDRIAIEHKERTLSLTPFAMYLKCPQCHTDEVFYLDQVARRPVYKSLREGGHRIQSLSEAGKDARQTKIVEETLKRYLETL